MTMIPVAGYMVPFTLRCSIQAVPVASNNWALADSSPAQSFPQFHRKVKETERSPLQYHLRLLALRTANNLALVPHQRGRKSPLPSFQLGMKQLGEATALPSTFRQVDDSGSVLAWPIQTDQYQLDTVVRSVHDYEVIEAHKTATGVGVPQETPTKRWGGVSRSIPRHSIAQPS